jgi:hypothetical protein
MNLFILFQKQKPTYSLGRNIVVENPYKLKLKKKIQIIIHLVIRLSPLINNNKIKIKQKKKQSCKEGFYFWRLNTNHFGRLVSACFYLLYFDKIS